MASSTHGPGNGLQGVGQYSDAVFRFAEEARPTSRSVSTSTAPRDSPRPQPTQPVVQTSTPTFAGPFTCQPNARLTPFPIPRTTGHGLLSGSNIHPSDLEAIHSLTRLSSSVEPRSISQDKRSLSPSQADSYSLQRQSVHTVNNSFIQYPSVTATIPIQHHIPKSEIDGSPHLVADHPSHPSISSEENAGRHSDVFSMAENSDTISDPDIDVVDRNGPSQVSQPFILDPTSFRKEEAAPSSARSMPSHTIMPANGITPSNHISAGLNGEGANHFIMKHQLDENYTPVTQTPGRKLYDPTAPILPVHGNRCICRCVPDVFLRILDASDEDEVDVNTLTKLYGACKNDLCPLHLDAFARLITHAVNAIQAPAATLPAQQAEQQQLMEPIDHEPVKTGSGTTWRAAPYRRRTTSTPGIYEYEIELPSKRPRLAGNHSPNLNNGHSSPGNRSSRRPQLDIRFDECFRQQVLGELAHGFTELKENEWSRGETTNRYIHAILSKCQHPNADPRKGAVDAGFLSGQEAADAIERGTERIPIFTDGQQPFQWKSGDRPIIQLFSRMEDLTREVSVQIPSHNFDLPSYQNKSLTEVQDRFMNELSSPDPWNILDLRSPLPPMVLPDFLTGENCQVLPRIRDSLLEGHTAERTKASRDDWNEWTDLLEWVLMSEGGHNTAPHMDSHGWSTWITIQEGNFGFGWLSRPTDEERDDWMSNPLEYTGGNWRFAILKPGQTVFFPSGTIHFVFRLHDKQTLALGGHLLQWTALVRWVEVILWQLKNPNITNEDLGKSPLKYIRIARKLVDHRMATSRIQTMGGMEAVTKFMVLATEVERWYARKQKKRLR
ncbi:hypothetical protein N0V93_001468 [Gnomoniopsis smithogilvyi]|uniref:JmjC domain-containing protein n=1 Tax=Gnomoniopsis smithogilvyi TaxID=1191159 RepID=A0A9W8Z5L1_9PEZI|nr:hypothetical protein N0V93_001468 [Gnomoniopsis smithogilvyi]